MSYFETFNATNGPERKFFVIINQHGEIGMASINDAGIPGPWAFHRSMLESFGFMAQHLGTPDFKIHKGESPRERFPYGYGYQFETWADFYSAAHDRKTIRGVEARALLHLTKAAEGFVSHYEITDRAKKWDAEYLARIEKEKQEKRDARNARRRELSAAKKKARIGD